MNQILDAGTLANSMGGLISHRLKAPRGAFRRKPFEFTEVHGNFDDISKMVMFWPTKEPSPVLFNLLQLMINSGKEIANTLDLQAGEAPGQNQPLGTTQIQLEQGLKIYNAVFRRVWRGMSNVYARLRKLNRDFLEPEKYLAVLDLSPEIMTGNLDPTRIVEDDFDDSDFDIVPSANPNADHHIMRLTKARDLLEVAPNTPLAIENFLVAMGADEIAPIKAWLQAPPPAVPADVQLEMQKFNHQREMDWIDRELRSLEVQYQALSDKARAFLNMAKGEQIGQEAASKEMLRVIDGLSKTNDAIATNLQMQLQARNSLIEEDSPPEETDE
jgi:chaperonin GroES